MAYVIGAGGHAKIDILAIAAGAVAARAVLAASGLVVWLIAEIEQRCQERVHDQIDMAASPAVAAIGAAERYVFLVAEAHATVAAVARLEENFGMIHKHTR